MTHMYFSARAEGIRTFRHALRAAYRTAISAAQILVTRYYYGTRNHEIVCLFPLLMSLCNMHRLSAWIETQQAVVVL